MNFWTITLAATLTVGALVVLLEVAWHAMLRLIGAKPPQAQLVWPGHRVKPFINREPLTWGLGIIYDHETRSGGIIIGPFSIGIQK